MKHEKIIKREDGTQYLISVSFYTDRMKPTYSYSLKTRNKGKRKWLPIDFCDWEYRNLNMDERNKFLKNKYLEHVTAEEIKQTKLELWEMIKPV